MKKPCPGIKSVLAAKQQTPSGEAKAWLLGKLEFCVLQLPSCFPHQDTI